LLVYGPDFASRDMGRAWVFALAVAAAAIVVWAVTGPFFSFSDTWRSSRKAES
jgi:low affinity Fe/Cu permease